MCGLKLHVRVPMDCWRQWIRHRTANVNEYSTRYSEAIDACQKTPSDSWRTQCDTNKQGSGNMIDATVGGELSNAEVELHRFSREIYETRLKAGVAREQARKDLPLSTYTEAYWKIDLHNLFHFLELRMDAHAQLEIRSYATIIGNEIVARWCPIAWEAFTDYRTRALSLNRFDVEIATALVSGNTQEAVKLAIQFQLLDQNGQTTERNREREELESKMVRLGLLVPWIK